MNYKNLTGNFAMDNGDTFSTASMSDQPFVIFFYPKDDTPGCTKESIEFSNKLQDFHNLGIKVFGCSPDSVESHCDFRNKHSLMVPLISDPDKTISNFFGVWKEKSMFGKKYFGIERTTVLFGKNLKLLKTWNKVSVTGHVDDVLQSAKTLIS